MISTKTKAARETQIVPVRPLGGLSPRLEELTPQGLIELWLNNLRSDHSRRAYEADLRAFAKWLDVESPSGAVVILVSADQGTVNRMGIAFQTSLRQDGLSPGSINRTVAAMKSLLKMARQVGLTLTSLETRRLRHESYRETAGPPRPVLQGMFKALEDGKATGKWAETEGRILHVRNLALVRLMYLHGLRVGEVTGMDLHHYDPVAQAVSIMGKARLERETIKLVPKAAAALEAWIDARGDEPGPMFPTIGSAGTKVRKPMIRLDRKNIGNALKSFGVRSPHALRHAAITRLLELNGGDVAAAMAFSRHKSPAVLMRYRDNAAKFAEKSAGLLNDDL